jgi:integrase
MDTHNREIVFVGPNGRPPVRFHPKGRSDCVAPWWSRLVKRAGVQPLTFRYLRKTAADMVRKLSDKDTSEAMLSHSNGGVVKVYSNHDWAKLEAALRGLHQQLLPALVVADKKPFLTRRRAK